MLRKFAQYTYVRICCIVTLEQRCAGPNTQPYNQHEVAKSLDDVISLAAAAATAICFSNITCNWCNSVYRRTQKMKLSVYRLLLC